MKEEFIEIIVFLPIPMTMPTTAPIIADIP
jgi:hypothetical protein